MKTKTVRRKKFLITVLVIVLLGIIFCLAIVWLRNAMEQPAAPSGGEDVKVGNQQPIPTTPARPTMTVAYDESLGSGFAVNYPEGWTNVHESATDPEAASSIQTDRNIITSPSGNLQVILQVQTNRKIGTRCTPSYIKLKHLEAGQAELAGYKEGRFAFYVVYFPSLNLYQYHAGLQKNTIAVRSVTLDNNTACNFMFSEFIERESSKPNVPVTYTLLGIKAVNLYDGDNLKRGVTETEVIEALSGDEYEQAKEIVSSAYVRD